MTPWLPALGAMLCAGIVHAHPLGNNTVNRAALIQVERAGLAVRYLVDMAEIPTLLAAQAADTDGDGETTDAEWDAYGHRCGAEILAGIEIMADTRPLPVALDAARWQRVPGAAGLATLRLEVLLSAALGDFEAAHIEYRDHRQPDEVGWKEVSAGAGRGIRIAHADVPQTSPSRDLTVYPALVSLPPQVLSARLDVEAGPREVQTAAGIGDPVETALMGAGTLDAQQVATPPPAPLARPDAKATGTALASLVPQPRPSLFSQTGAFFRLGVHHIATGLDHLVFLLGLIVAQKSRRRLAWVITAFTAAHSLTLGLAASGLVAPPGKWVEPAIALTIAYVGLACLGEGLRHGAGVAFVFGLIHGFGFAGVLAESLAGTQTGGSGWLFDLALFNLGVEAGQFAFVLLVILFDRAFCVLEIRWPPAVQRFSGSLLGALGAYWTVQSMLVL